MARPSIKAPPRGCHQIRKRQEKPKMFVAQLSIGRKDCALRTKMRETLTVNIVSSRM
jgi:hypothetical protein